MLTKEGLPPRIKKLSAEMQDKWLRVFNNVAAREGDKMAFLIANKILLKSKSQFIKKSLVLKLDTKNGNFIKKGLLGDTYCDFVLTDTGYDGHGDCYSPRLLQEWASKINSGEIQMTGDQNHVLMDELVAMGLSDDEIEEKLKGKQGFAKTVKAMFKKGKLWVRTVFDPIYKNIINKSSGVSLEARVKKQDDITKMITQGDLTSFSFMVGQKPANPRAVIAA